MSEDLIGSAKSRVREDLRLLKVEKIAELLKMLAKLEKTIEVINRKIADVEKADSESEVRNIASEGERLY